MMYQMTQILPQGAKVVCGVNVDVFNGYVPYSVLLYLALLLTHEFDLTISEKYLHIRWQCTRSVTTLEIGLEGMYSSLDDYSRCTD